MKIQLIAVGTKMPKWIQSGFEDYQRRFPKEMSLELIEIPAVKRGKLFDVKRTLQKEGEQMLAAIKKHARIISLEVEGKQWDTLGLAKQLTKWRALGKDVALLVGGPEGLSQVCKQAAHQQWSLSPLTLPHPVVRVIVAESLYRAWSINNNLPYHRE